MKITQFLPKGSDNEWAGGCDNFDALPAEGGETTSEGKRANIKKCKYGIVSSPTMTGACNLYLERLVQFNAKQIVFCACQAGIRYRVHLQNVRQKLIEEARSDPRMQESARRLTHPEIEMAEWQITASYLMMPAPAMHYEKPRHAAPQEEQPQ